MTLLLRLSMRLKPTFSVLNLTCFNSSNYLLNNMKYHFITIFHNDQSRTQNIIIKATKTHLTIITIKAHFQFSSILLLLQHLFLTSTDQFSYNQNIIQTLDQIHSLYNNNYYHSPNNNKIDHLILHNHQDNNTFNNLII